MDRDFILNGLKNGIFLVDTLNWFLNIIPDKGHFCNKACRNLNFMVT